MADWRRVLLPDVDCVNDVADAKADRLHPRKRFPRWPRVRSPQGWQSPATIARMYPRLEEFGRANATVDLDGVFQSDLSRRLDISRGGGL